MEMIISPMKRLSRALFSTTVGKTIIIIVVVVCCILRFPSHRHRKLRKAYEFLEWGDSHLPLTGAERLLLEEKLLKAERDTKIILIWNPFVKSKVGKLDRRCGSCNVSIHNNLISHGQTAAVVMHYSTIEPKRMAPSHYRREDQLYVWSTLESSFSMNARHIQNFTFHDEQNFNATMNMWKDGDITQNYGGATVSYWAAHRRLKKFNNNIENVLKLKTTLAVAIISDCEINVGAKLRMRIVEGMERHGLGVDKFGRCFNRIFNGTTKSDLIQYKFYLAFENSYHCKNYISEKFVANSISNFAVPIVWGTRKKDYELFVPPNSFIHVDDFNSYDELVQYIKYLDRNDTAYKEYFRWIDLPIKKMPYYDYALGNCQLCRILHGINVDDMRKPSFNRSRLERPLFTDGVARRQLPALRELFRKMEDPDCFLNYTEVMERGETLATKS